MHALALPVLCHKFHPFGWFALNMIDVSFLNHVGDKEFVKPVLLKLKLGTSSAGMV